MSRAEQFGICGEDDKWGPPPPKYARKTVRFGSREKKTNKSVYLPKYAQIEPHIMPIIGQ